MAIFNSNTSTESDLFEATTAKGYTQADVDKLIPVFLMYAAQGVLLILTNAPTLTTVLRYSNLRTKKGYVVIAGLAMADMLNGFASLFAGVERTIMILNQQALVLRTRWECAMTSWNILGYWTNPLGGVMLTTVTLDRLFAVALPIWYYKLTHRYAFTLVGLTLLYVWTGTAIGMYWTYTEYNSKPEFISICYTVWSVHPAYLSYQYFMRVGGSFASVIIYLMAYILITSRGEFLFILKNRVNENRTTMTDNEQSQLWKKQLQLTATVGISTFFTFVFFVVPYSVEIYLKTYHNADVTFIVPYVYTLNNVNAMLNCFIYAFRQRDLRSGFKRLVRPTPVTSVSQTNANTVHR